MINLVEVLKHLSILAIVLEAIHRILVFAVNVLEGLMKDKEDPQLKVAA